jgi:hypothetical protein
MVDYICWVPLACQCFEGSKPCSLALHSTTLRVPTFPGSSHAGLQSQSRINVQDNSEIHVRLRENQVNSRMESPFTRKALASQWHHQFLVFTPVNSHG